MIIIMIEIIRIDLNNVNCYLVKSENNFILVDTGGHIVMDKEFTNRREKLIKALEAASCSEQNLKLIILTHGDNDHSGNAAYLGRKFKAKIAIHSGDRELVENPKLSKWMESFRYQSLVYKLVFRLLNKVITKATQKALDDFEPFTPDILLTDGFDFSPYGVDASIIHLPGHTKGSVAILTKDGDLIAGDTFSNNKKPALVANAYDFKQLSASVEKLKKFKIKTIYPGHGNPFEFKEIKS